MSSQREPEPRPAPRAPGRLRRATAAAATTLGLSLVFAAATAAGVALHLDTAAARRVARDATNVLLGSLFQGRIVADEIDALGLEGVRIRAAVAFDPWGNQVIRASGIEARADVLAMLRGAFLGEGARRIEIPYIRVEKADVRVEGNGAGSVTLGDTFTPRPSSRPPSAPSEGPPRPVVVALSHIEIGRGWVHGQLAPPRALDADVSRLIGSVHVRPEGVAVDVEHTGLVDRAFLPATTAGTADYHLRAGDQIRMWSSFAGRLADVEITARAVLDEEHLEATASVPRATPDQLRSLLPDHPLTEPIAAEVRLVGGLPHLDVTASIAAVPAGPAGGSLSLEGRLDVTGPVRIEAEARARDVALGLFGVDLSSPAADAPRDALARRTAPSPASAPGPRDAPARRAAVPLAAARGPRNAPARRAAASPADARVPRNALVDAGPSVDADGRVRIEVGDVLRLAAEVRTAPTELLGQPVPEADVHLVVDRGELHARVHLHEPGMPIDAAISYLPGGQGLRFEATADIPAIAAAPRLAGPVSGAGRVRVQGSLRNGELDARAAGAFAALRLGEGAGLGSARLEGRVSGPLDALVIDGSLSGQEALAGGYAFDALTAKASGPLASPRLHVRLTDGDDALDASGRLTARTGALRDIELRLTREGNAVAGRIAAIAPSKGGVTVEGIELAGEQLGSLKGGLAVRGDDVTGALRGENIDLGRVGRMLGLPIRVRGLANVDVELARDDKNGRSGRVLLELTGGEIAFLPGVSAQLAATFDRDALKADGLVSISAPVKAPGGPRAEGAVQRCAGPIARVRLSNGEGVLKGPLLRAETWADLVGTAEVAADAWDLGCLAELAPIGHLVSEVRGRLSTRFQVARAPDEPFPSLRGLHLRTHGLAVLGPHPFGADRPDWESTSIDVQLRGSLDGVTGKAEAALTLYDGALLGDASGSIDLDLGALFGAPADRRRSLLRSRITARASIPRRAMSGLTTLPSFVRDALPPLGGELRVDAYANGTLERPFLAARTLWWGLTYATQSGPGSADFVFPADVDALVTYDSAKATLDAHVTRGAREIATVRGEVLADLDHLLAGQPPRPPKGGAPRPLWTGSVRATLSGVPLGDIPMLGDSGVGGHVSGSIDLRHINLAPRLVARIEVPDLKLGGERFRGAMALRIAPAEEPGRGTLRLSKLTLTSETGGTLRANAFAGVRFGDGLLPALDGGRADVAISAERFRLAALHPLVGRTLSKLDGIVDGDVHAELGGASGEGGGSLRAHLEVSDGVVHIPELGQELRGVTARVTAENGVVRVEHIDAAGTTGRAQGWALLRLNGLALRDGAGRLNIAEDEALPLTLEGVPLGSASGELVFIVEKKPRELAFNVTVPSLHVKLPATTARDVQPLVDNPDIAVSHPVGPEKERRAPDALRYTMTFDVKDALLEGSGLRLRLAGVDDAPPRVVLGETAQVSGDIVITRGTFEVFGKTFEIESGLVRLREREASNPWLNVTARWDAPDGTRIYVDYIGELRPITDKKLRFRSSPPSSQKDILARLLFGADFSEGAQAAGAETPALQAAGGVAASVGSELASAQFNTLLSGIAPLRGLSTRFGTTSDGSLRTSLVYQLDDNLTAQATFQEGSSQSTTPGTEGAAPAAAQRGGRTEITIDWRFHPNWTLRGTVGLDDRQTSSGVLDLLWQYRY